MAVSLKKGQGVSLKKNEYNLSMVTVGLGWDINEPKKGLIGSLFGKKEEDYDLDVVAFLCDAHGKVRNLGEYKNDRPTLENGDVVFYNNMRHNSGCVWLTGDNRTGAGDGDDEQIILKLNEIPDEYKKVVFVVQIYQGEERNQSFGKVDNAFIRAVDANGKEMVRFDLSGGAAFDAYRSMLFAEFEREANGWKFNAVGVPDASDTFVSWLRQYAS